MCDRGDFTRGFDDQLSRWIIGRRGHLQGSRSNLCGWRSSLLRRRGVDHSRLPGRMWPLWRGTRRVLHRGCGRSRWGGRGERLSFIGLVVDGKGGGVLSRALCLRQMYRETQAVLDSCHATCPSALSCDSPSGESASLSEFLWGPQQPRAWSRSSVARVW